MDTNYISRDIHVVKRFFWGEILLHLQFFLLTDLFAEFVCAELRMVCACFLEIHFHAKMQNPAQKNAEYAIKFARFSAN